MGSGGRSVWLRQVYLIDPALVPASFKPGCEEYVHYGIGLGGRYKPSGQGQYVGIVVAAAQAGYLGHPAQGGAYASVLVERNADAFSAAAHGNSTADLAALYGPCQGVGVVGIVAALWTMRPEVLVFQAPCFKVGLHMLLKLKAGMVAGQSDDYCFHILVILVA